MPARNTLQEKKMAFTMNIPARCGLNRIANLPYKSLRALSIRQLSEKLSVGPAPNDVLKEGDSGFEYFSRNLEKVRKDGRITYLTPEQMPNLDRLTLQEATEIRRLFEDLLRSNETLSGQVRQLNNRVEQLINNLPQT